MGKIHVCITKSLFSQESPFHLVPCLMKEDLLNIVSTMESAPFFGEFARVM